MAVTFTEIDGSPTFAVGKDGVVARRVGIVAWNDIDAFLEAQFGASGFVAGETAVQPLQATFPGREWLVVDGVEIEPFDPHNPGPADVHGVSTYAAGAKVTLTYRTQTYEQTATSRPDDPDVPEGTFLSHRVAMSAQYQMLPTSSLAWQADEEPIADDVTAGLVIPTDEHILTWHFVPQPPWEAMRTLRGRVNHESFLGYSAGTVLYMGAEASRDLTFQGSRSWTLEYHFQVRTVPLAIAGGVGGWNHFYRSDPGEGAEPWQQVVHRDNLTQPIYESGDLTGLFRFEGGA